MTVHKACTFVCGCIRTVRCMCMPLPDWSNGQEGRKCEYKISWCMHVEGCVRMVKCLSMPLPNLGDGPVGESRWSSSPWDTALCRQERWRSGNLQSCFYFFDSRKSKICTQVHAQILGWTSAFPPGKVARGLPGVAPIWMSSSVSHQKRSTVVTADDPDFRH